MGWLAFWVEFVLAVAVLLAMYWWRKTEENGHSDLVEKLPGPEVYPLIGNAWTVWGQTGDFFQNLASCISSFPSPMRLLPGWKLYVIFRDPIQIEKIFTSSVLAFKDHTYDVLKGYTGDALVSSSGHKWKKNRRLLSPIFLKKNISQYEEVITRHSKILLEALEDKLDVEILNVDVLIERAVADIIMESIIGTRTSAQKGDLDYLLEAVKSLNKVNYEKLTKPWLHFPLVYFFTPTYRRQIQSKEMLHRFFWKAFRYAEQIHSHLGKKDATRSVLEQMMDIRDEVPDFATDQEFVHHLTAFFLASHGTVSTIASFTLLMLGMHQQYQDEVAAEILSVIGTEEVKEEHLPRLEKLEMVLKECMRLFPVAPAILRQASQNIELAGYTIPKGTSVVVAVHNIHRDPAHWEKPDQFFPDHFTPSAIRKRHAYAYLPFSAGVRSCLGKPFAYVLLKILVVSILQRYVIEAEGTLQELLVTVDVNSVMKNRNGSIRLKKRW